MSDKEKKSKKPNKKKGILLSLILERSLNTNSFLEKISHKEKEREIINNTQYEAAPAPILYHPIVKTE